MLHDYAGRPHYVSADQVASIQEGVVRLTITDEASQHLPGHQAPESALILPESASLKDRIETDIKKHSSGHRAY